MKHKGISQEALKLIACASMLIDHIGYVFFPYTLWLRYIGRLAFPIYCFLLTEGAHYTGSPGKYALRLGIGALLAELPFDLLFFGTLTLGHQSVMITLLLGFAMIQCMKKAKHFWMRLLLIAPFYALANWLHTDYSGRGILLIAVFYLTREDSWRYLPQTLGLIFLFALPDGTGTIPWTAFAVLAMIPIALYSGRKATASKGVQTGFYLFYPVHLTVLFLVRMGIYLAQIA